jgi:hypothetical protein
MVSGLTRSLHGGNWLSFNLLSPCLSAGILLFASQQATAQIQIRESLAPLPEPESHIQKALEERSPSLERLPATDRSSTYPLAISPSPLEFTPQEFPPFEFRDGKPTLSIVIPPDPSLHKPTLPPLGDSTYYLPIDTDALGMRLIVKLSKRRVYLYKRDQVVASYPIAIGKTGWETPVGEYKVFNMEKNPIFKSFKSGRVIKPGPDNPLGVRWIGIWTDGKTQLGFHGTNEPELIGHAVSHGCIRMLNKDVTALFDQIAIGTPVKVEK